MASDGDFVQIEKLNTAGLGDTDKRLPFFRREGFIELSDFCDGIIAGAEIGLIDGLPGTGKSSTLWYKILSLSGGAEKSTLWIHLDHNGTVTAFVKVDVGVECERLPLPRFSEIGHVLKNSKEDVLVIDGANHNIFSSCLEEIRIWKGKQQGRVGFATMSNKIKREHRHELKAMKASGIAQNYFTLHSWTLDEYIKAILQQDGTRSKLMAAHIAKFEEEWEIEDDDAEIEKNQRAKRCKLNLSERKPIASVEEVVTQKFFFAGGSARWMLVNTTQEIEEDIRSYLDETDNLSELLNFNLGPGSSIAKTHLFSSAPGTNGTGMHYKLVSERATQLLVERVGRSGINMLYSHAAKINNSAFLGWIIEADYFSRCETNSLQLVRPGGTLFDVPCPNPPVEFDVGVLELLSSLNDKTELKRYLANVIIPGSNSVVVCKPTKWNQGGYDVVRIEKTPASGRGTDEGTDKIRVDLLFGQVTKSLTHSLKLWFFEHLAEVFVAAGYEVGSIEIGFIVLEHQMESFSVPCSAVTSSGRLIQHTVYGSTETWANKKEHEHVVVYGLPCARN